MVRELASGRSRYETLESLGLRGISVGTATDPEERVNAARLMIPMCWFDAERCAGGFRACGPTASDGTGRPIAMAGRCTTRPATAPTRSGSSR